MRAAKMMRLAFYRWRGGDKQEVIDPFPVFMCFRGGVTESGTVLQRHAFEDCPRFFKVLQEPNRVQMFKRSKFKIISLQIYLLMISETSSIQPWYNLRDDSFLCCVLWLTSINPISFVDAIPAKGHIFKWREVDKRDGDLATQIYRKQVVNSREFSKIN